MVKKKTNKNNAANAAYAALLMRQNEHRFYFTTVPVDDLFPYCFVVRRDEDPEIGFQRALSEDRAQDIAKYLANGTGSIPTNIVLSAQRNAELTYDRATKSISFQRITKAFLVLDGQHRLWGYQKCSSRHRVPVAIYQDLSREEEARLFIDINTTQRGVPAALLLDIKQLAALESKNETILRQMFDRLAEDVKSPIAGKLSPARSMAGKVSRVTFNRAVGQALQSSYLTGMDAEMRYRLLLNYLRSFDAELKTKDKSLLVRSSYFEAMFDVFDDVVRATLASQPNLKVEALRQTIQPIASIDLSGTVGTSTKKTIATLMRSTLHKTAQISQDMV